MEYSADWKTDILPLCPLGIQRLLQPIEAAAPLEELRLREGQPVELVFGGYSRLISAPGGRSVVEEGDCAYLVERICGHSAYAWEEELRQGFVTLEGGYRVGLSGRAVVKAGRVSALSDITSLNIRIVRSCPGAADKVLPLLLTPIGTPLPTLIFSAPGCGKTTLLRDLARQISYGIGGARPARVFVADERMELSGSVRGRPQHDLGPRTDVLSGCPKGEAFSLALRSMSPEVLVTDELGGEGDADAVEEAAFCGVTVLASAHGGDIRALCARPALGRLLESGAFSRLVRLGRSGGVGTVEAVYDGAGRPLGEKEGRPCCAC